MGEATGVKSVALLR